MIDQTADESRSYTSCVAQEGLDQLSHRQNQGHHPCAEPQPPNIKCLQTFDISMRSALCQRLSRMRKKLENERKSN